MSPELPKNFVYAIVKDVLNVNMQLNENLFDLCKAVILICICMDMDIYCT